MVRDVLMLGIGAILTLVITKGIEHFQESHPSSPTAGERGVIKATLKDYAKKYTSERHEGNEEVLGNLEDVCIEARVELEADLRNA